MSDVNFDRIAQTRRSAEEISGLSFSVWIGESDESPRAHAERLHAALARPERSVYVACNTRQRSLEVVTGAGARQTLTDEECAEATQAMKDLLVEGDITRAVVRGLEHLGSYAMQ